MEKKENGYLKISRFEGQSINIGDEISVAVSGFRRGKVILAVKAPREVPIRRIDERFTKRKKINALAQQVANGN